MDSRPRKVVSSMLSVSLRPRWSLSMKPSLRSRRATMRPEARSESGPDATAPTPNVPWLPALASIRPSAVAIGALVTTLTRPAKALAPYSVPCGPRSTSICCTSYRPTTVPTPERSTPSTTKPTDEFSGSSNWPRSPMPRSCRKRARDAPLAKFRLAIAPSTSSKWVAERAAISAAPSTLTLDGTSRRLSSPRVAVTTTSSIASARSPAAGASSAAKVPVAATRTVGTRTATAAFSPAEGRRVDSAIGCSPWALAESR